MRIIRICTARRITDGLCSVPIAWHRFAKPNRQTAESTCSLELLLERRYFHVAGETILNALRGDGNMRHIDAIRPQSAFGLMWRKRVQRLISGSIDYAVMGSITTWRDRLQFVGTMLELAAIGRLTPVEQGNCVRGSFYPFSHSE